MSIAVFFTDGHVNSAVKNNVPSSSQSDVLPCTSTQSERDDWTYSQRIHIDDENKMIISHAHYQAGSTFTRGFFDLKGHLRSHFDEKPYKWHWPGSYGKGFPRQHDCKRHHDEQLHSNFLPFECEGCRKQFARMDALNRHLKSETRVECARVVERGKGSGGGVLGD